MLPELTKLKITTEHCEHLSTHLVTGDGREDAFVRPGTGSELSAMISKSLNLGLHLAIWQVQDRSSWRKIWETAVLTQWARHPLMMTISTENYLSQHTYSDDILLLHLYAFYCEFLTHCKAMHSRPLSRFTPTSFICWSVWADVKQPELRVASRHHCGHHPVWPAGLYSYQWC